MEYDFIIYGSGISAKISSIALAKKGFSVCIILDSSQENEKKSSNLVTFLSIGSINYLSTIISDFSELQRYEDVCQIICQHSSASKYDDQIISFSEEENSCLGKIVPNSNIEKYLNSDLKALSNIDIIANQTIMDIQHSHVGIDVKLENNAQYFAKLLIISSSKNPNLLKDTKIKFIKKDFSQKALSITVKGNFIKNNCAFQKFTSEGPLAFLPYYKNEASIVWSVNKKSHIQFCNELEIISKLEYHLQKYIESLEIINSEKHTLKFSFAKKLFDKKIVLLGNIAHTIHPIAGQGLNLNIKDISLFVETMSKYKLIGYNINDNFILNDFDYKRKLDNTAYSFGTQTLETMLSNNNKYINFAVSQGLKAVNRNKYIKKLIVNSATGKNFFNTI